VSAASSRVERMAVTVSVHVYPETPVRVRLHPDQDRIVVIFGEGVGVPTVDLYLQRAELIALRDTLAAAVSDLDTAQHTTAAHDDDDNDNDTTADEGETASADEVRAPAA